MKKILATVLGFAFATTLVVNAQDATPATPAMPAAPAAPATPAAPAEKPAKHKASAEQKAIRKELLEKYDTNKDGKLDKQERAAMTKEDKEKLGKAGGRGGKKK